MMVESRCQINCVPIMSERIGLLERVWQCRNRLKRIIKRRKRYLANSFFGESPQQRATASIEAGRVNGSILQAGDLVRVRSKNEIQKTLDKWNYLRGCGFMEEMWPYCGTTQRVFKRMEKFLDERDYLMKKCRGIVILDGVFCEGTKDYGRCDRTCFYFWREEWLEKIG